MAQTKRTLSVSVLERYMTPEQLEQLQREYAAHKKGYGARSRFDVLSTPITPEEKTQLTKFFDSTMKTEDVVKEFGMKSYQGVIDRVNRICRRVVFQNKEKVL